MKQLQWTRRGCRVWKWESWSLQTCLVNCGRVPEHSSLPSHPFEGLELNDAHSLWFTENKHKIIGFNDNRQVERNNALISIVEKSLSGIKNWLFPLTRASRPQYISHFKLAHAWAETGLVVVWLSELLSDFLCWWLLTKPGLTLHSISTPGQALLVHFPLWSWKCRC